MVDKPFHWESTMVFLRYFTAAFCAFCAASAAFSQPALCTLQDDDTTVHLFGTVHVLPANIDWRHGDIDTAFGEADTFCVETDIIGNLGEVLQFTTREGLFTGDERLSDHLTDQQEADLRELAADLGILYQGLDVQKPWNALFSLSEAIARRSGMHSHYGVEMSLLPEAHETGKAICEMESPEEHVVSISSLPIEVQLAALMGENNAFETGEEAIDTAIADLKGTVADWAEGDIEALAAIDEEDFGHPEFYEAILTKRNRNWVPRIEALLDEPGVKFVAVGAAHLAGPESVVVMLRDLGYSVDGP